MESRRIVLLTEGYLSGWLDFDYKTPLSKVRENYILSNIEKRCALDALRLKTITEASIVSGVVSSETLKIPYDDYNRYLALALPYLSKTDSIKETGPVLNKEEIAHWKKFLEDKKKWAGTVKHVAT